MRYQMQAGDYGAAANTLRPAADAHPEDRDLQLSLAEALLHAGRKQDSAAAAQKALDGCDDPYMLNNAAYVLSETGEQMPVAEAASRRSVDLLEAKSASLTLDQVNNRAFGDSNMLLASWDTLGWILFQQAKYSEALPLIQAAWRNDLHAEVGDHLGQVYEALGDNQKAAMQYRLAFASIEGSVQPEVKVHLQTSLHRLDPHYDAAHDRAAQSSALQESRTYKLPRPAGLKGWGTFRLLIAPDGSVAAAQQASGDLGLKPMEAALKSLKLPGLVPDGSKAHLLRSGVLSCSADPCNLVLVPNASLQTELEAK